MNEIDEKTISTLIESAQRVLPNSYSPYSGIRVAAAVLTDTGRIYVGVNVENASYGLTICAERSAISAMIANGDRKPIAVAIVTDLDTPIPPCGACRQVLAEFNPMAMVVMYSVKTGRRIVSRLDDLFPYPFKI